MYSMSAVLRPMVEDFKILVCQWLNDFHTCTVPFIVTKLNRSKGIHLIWEITHEHIMALLLLSQRIIPLATVWEVSKRALQLIGSVDNVQQPAQRRNVRYMYISRRISCQLHLHMYTHHYRHCMYLHVYYYSLTRRCSLYALENNTYWIVMSWKLMIQMTLQCNWASTLVLSCSNCSTSRYSHTNTTHIHTKCMIE